MFHNAPILVYGPRKGGTTLLQSLLDGGQDVVMLPGELKLKWLAQRTQLSPQQFAEYYAQRGRLDFQFLLQRDERNQVLKPLRAKPSYHFASFSTEQTNQIFDPARYAHSLEELRHQTFDASTHEALASQILTQDVDAFIAALKTPNPNWKTWGSKEVGGDTRVVLEDKIVFLVREPVFVVRSIITDRRRKNQTMSAGQIWRECREAQNIISAAFEYSHRELMVTYENLTTDVESEMKRVAEYLGISDEKCLTNPTTLGIEMIVRTASREEKGVFKQSPDWRTNLTPREIRVISLFQKLAPTLYKLRGQNFVSYATLLQKLQQPERVAV
jgi:hypothetical protein